MSPYHHCNMQQGHTKFLGVHILNVAISDMIILTLLFDYAFAYRIPDVRLHDDIVCEFLPFCYWMSFGPIPYSVAVFSIQRYMVTVNPLYVHVSSQPTWRAAGTAIFGVWIVAVLFIIPAARSKYIRINTVFLLRKNVINIYLWINNWSINLYCYWVQSITNMSLYFNSHFPV
jgi:hypothetical protein